VLIGCPDLKPLYKKNVTYLPGANAGQQLFAVILVDPLPELLHVGAVRQLDHIGAHQTLQAGANARQIETGKRKKKSQGKVSGKFRARCEPKKSVQ